MSRLAQDKGERAVIVVGEMPYSCNVLVSCSLAASFPASQQGTRRWRSDPRGQTSAVRDQFHEPDWVKVRPGLLPFGGTCTF
jgi:hypothetical protein